MLFTLLSNALVTLYNIQWSDFLLVTALKITSLHYICYTTLQSFVLPHPSVSKPVVSLLLICSPTLCTVPRQSATCHKPAIKVFCKFSHLLKFTWCKTVRQMSNWESTWMSHTYRVLVVQWRKLLETRVWTNSLRRYEWQYRWTEDQHP